MGKQTPTPPPAPNPNQVAAAQTGSNVSTAIANSILGNANERTPWGSVEYRQIGSHQVPGGSTTSFSGGSSGNPQLDAKMGGVFGVTSEPSSYTVPQFERVTTLSPMQDRLNNYNEKLSEEMLNIARAQTARVGNTLSQPVTTNGLPERGQFGPTDYSEDRRRVEDALYSRLNPQLDRDRSSLENNLINQGLVRGSEPFTRAMDESNRQANEARMQVISQGGNEQTRLANLTMQRGQAQDVQRERALQEMLAMRNQPLNEVSALRAGNQVQMPQFSPYQGGQVAATPVGNYMYNSAAMQQNQYQQEQQNQNAMMGGLFGLGGTLGSAAMRWSDRRLKTDIKDTGTTLNSGLKVYTYRYLWEPTERVGVMADEVMHVRPEAVSNIGGYLAVDYGRL
jgi:hypothetical protein